MKKINFNFKILNLAGKDTETDTKELIANILASGNTAHPIRMMEIARKIYKTGIVELPSEDIAKLKETITNCRTITDLAKDQILQKFN